MSRSLKSFVSGVISGAALAFLIWGGVHYEKVKAAGAQLYEPLADSAPLDFPDPKLLPASVTPDPNWPFQDLMGREFKLADFRGKAVFLDFWATWCNDCTAEMGYIESLQRKLADAPVAFVLVSAENRSTVRKFVAAEHVSLPVYVAVTKPPAALETYGLPTTYILSSKREARLQARG
jgi:thiol-disulfide isomerase/thioredoxin